MDLLAILGLGALIRFFRRRGASNTHPPSDTPALPPGLALASAQAPLVLRTSSARRRLVLRACCAVLLALLCVVFALLPWPTAWAMSAAFAPDVRRVQLWVVHNVDVVTIGAVGIAVVEPLLVGTISLLSRSVCLLLGSLFQAPRTIGQIARLAGLMAVLGYWRTRRLLARQRWQACQANAFGESDA